MAWVEIHDTLPDHPKIGKVAEALKIDKDAVVGKLVRLWTWAINNREDGVLYEMDQSVIADVMRYKGKPKRLLDALIDARLIDYADGRYIIHDWDERAGMLLAKREAIRKQTRDRVKRYREKNVTPIETQESEQCNGDVTRYVTPEVTQCNARTVPYRTVPYTTTTTAETRAHDAEYSELIQIYEQNIRIPTPIEAESISQWMDDIPADVIDYAIKQAALSGIRSWRGVETILLRWQSVGVNTLVGAEAAQREWANRGLSAQPRAAAAQKPQGTLGRTMSNLDALMAQTLEEEHGHNHQG